MKKLFIILMIITTTGFAQTNQNGQQAKVISPDDRLSVIGESIIEVPASNVKFSLTLNTTDTLSMEVSYAKHRESEDKLVKLFKKFKIPDENINYSLASLSCNPATVNYSQAGYIRNPPQYHVQQQVTFVIDNIAQTTQLEELLITAGFTTFHSEFLLNNLEQYKSVSIENAFVKAKEKANLLAKLSERKIKRTIKIVTFEDRGASYTSREAAASYSDASMQSLTEIGQTVKITKRVSVDFELE